MKPNKSFVKGRDRWEDLGVDGRITLSWTLERYGANWVWLAQDRF
jgi:hypothetical protein